MPGERTYRTETGTYTESELAVLVWMNPDHEKYANSRLLATVTDRNNPHPMAFPITSLRNTSEFANAHFATEDSLAQAILDSTPHAPVVVSLPVARDHLGWTDFYVPTRYVEPR